MSTTPTTPYRRWGWATWIAGVTAITLIGFGAILAVTTLTVQGRTESLKASLEHPVTFDVPDPSPAPAVAVVDAGPSLLMVPALGVRIPTVGMGLDEAGNLAIPQASEAAVYTGSAPLTSPVGSTTIAGHVVDKAGRFAPMAALNDLTPGERVVTTDENGTRQDWIVTGKQVVDRDELTRDMWATDGPRRLVLITCAGQINTAVGAVTEYTQNLIITATPAG